MNVKACLSDVSGVLRFTQVLQQHAIWHKECMDSLLMIDAVCNELAGTRGHGEIGVTSSCSLQRLDEYVTRLRRYTSPQQ